MQGLPGAKHGSRCWSCCREGLQHSNSWQSPSDDQQERGLEQGPGGLVGQALTLRCWIIGSRGHLSLRTGTVNWSGSISTSSNCLSPTGTWQLKKKNTTISPIWSLLSYKHQEAVSLSFPCLLPGCCFKILPKVGAAPFSVPGIWRLFLKWWDKSFRPRRHRGCSGEPFSP